jgi:Major intrinsic protein
MLAADRLATLAGMTRDDIQAGQGAADVPRQPTLGDVWRSPWFELEIKVGRDFDDPSLEWRRLFSELLGTFLLVLVGAGGGVVNAVSHGAISRNAAVTAPGLMVMAIILFMGTVSGAHLNPAVTLGFAARGDFPWRRVPGYIIVQLAGATLACLFLWAASARSACWVRPSRVRVSRVGKPCSSRRC